MAEKVELACQGDILLVPFVEDVAHHLRQLHDSALGRLRVDVHQRVDVVERVHEEMRIYLVAKVFQLLFQVLLLQRGQTDSVLA